MKVSNHQSKHSSVHQKFQELELANSRRESQIEEGLKLLHSAESEGSSSLIGRQWHIVCAISIISYIVIQLLISYSASHICQEKQGFAEYTFNFGHAFVGRFSIPQFTFYLI